MTRDRAIAGTFALVSAAAVAAIYALSIALARSSAFSESPEVFAAAITLDLTVTASLAVYLLGVRRGHLPVAILFPVFFAGLLVAHQVVPAEHRRLASGLAAAWAVAELALLAFVLFKLRAVVRLYRRRREDGAALPDALEGALARVLGHPTVARMLADELSVLYFSTAGLFRRAPADRAPDRDETMWGAVLVGLSIAVVAEAFAAHLLLRAWSSTATVVAGVLHIYTVMWLIGDFRALKLSRGIRVADGRLRVDLGLRARAEIRLDDIARIERLDDSSELEEPEGYVRATIMGKPNVLVHLARPTPIRLSFGRLRQARVIGLAARDPGVLSAL